MPQQVEIPGKGTLEFPDGMTQDQMREAIQRNFPDLAQATETPAGPATEPGPQPETRTWSDVPGEAISNIPSSAFEFGKNIVQPILHPIKTAKALGKVAAGGLGKGAEALGMTPTSPENVAVFDSVIDMFKKRYGGAEELKETIATDPVGFAADVAAVLGVGGSALKTVGAAKAGEKAAKLASVIEPVGAVKTAGRTIAKAIPKSVPQKLYGSALKQSTKLPPAERLERIATGLKEGIVPTEAGLSKIQEKIGSLNLEIEKTIGRAAKAGDTVQADEIVKRIDDLKPFYQATANPAPYLDELERVKKSFQDYHGQRIPVEKAQKIKQNTYVLLKKQYGQMKNESVEAEKAIARGIKEELATKYPELKFLNQNESELIRLEDSIVKAVNRIENRDLVGIGSTIAGTAGAVVTGSPSGGFWAMMAKALIDHPTMKSRIAIALQNARKKAIVQETKMQLVRPAAAQAGRIKEEVDQEE